MIKMAPSWRPAGPRSLLLLSFAVLGFSAIPWNGVSAELASTPKEPASHSQTAPSEDVKDTSPDAREKNRYALLNVLELNSLGIPCSKDNEFKAVFYFGGSEAMTWKPGFRVDGQYEHNSKSGFDDFFLRRVRYKCGGKIFRKISYYAELEIDNLGRNDADVKPQIQHLLIDFPIYENSIFLRAGYDDIPFSRDALTSSAKLLFIDTSLIVDALNDIGLADLGIGFWLHGRPFGGHFEYAFGIFDNQVFKIVNSSDGRKSDQLMPAARIVFNFWDPSKPPDGWRDYLGSYLCKGMRLCLGFDAAYLGGCEEEKKKFEIYAFGADLFCNIRCFTFQAEYDWYQNRGSGYGWYAQTGYLFSDPFEFAARYQELAPSREEDGERKQETTLGLNCYIREHHIKIQANCSFIKEHETRSNYNRFQLQGQVDF